MTDDTAHTGTGNSRADETTHDRDAATAGGEPADRPAESGDDTRRRRRRGRRGRGRSGSTNRSRTPDERSADASFDDAGAEKNRGGAASGSSHQSPRGGAAPVEEPRSDTEETESAGDGESAVEASIARDGTRVAAKKGSRRASGGGGRRSPSRPGGVPEEVRRAILEGPPRTMLVSARQERTQIAVLEERTLVEHYVTRNEDVTYVGNIYMARVQNVLPGMEAAFLDIGKGRNGVLYAGEVLFDELDLEEGSDERIENALKPGQTVLVQVTKDPMGSKGPRLTMHLSLAGRYLVLAPNSELFGISRKLTEKERDRLRRIVKQLKPGEHGVIVRTAAEGASHEQVSADLARLLAKWEKVCRAAEDASALTAVYEEPPLVVKVIRDAFGPEYERCIVDDEELFQQVRGYLAEVAPELLEKVELYGTPTADAAARAAGALPGTVPEEASAADRVTGQDDDSPAAAGSGEPTQDSPAVAGDDAASPDRLVETTALGADELAAAAGRRAELPELFAAYDVSDQLRKAMGRKVWLPSGGYLIVEFTEAMKVIDVNTGKFTGGRDTNLEEVVLKTNLEAADEIVRQLRLRDMGGIIVIDFIDMLLKANQDQVVRRLKRELLRDRTKTRVSEVSRLGLVQMTRKNVSQGLLESFSHTCEECEGRGLISELA